MGRPRPPHNFEAHRRFLSSSWTISDASCCSMLALVKHLPVRNRTGLDRCTFPRQVASDGGEPRSSIDPPSDAVPSWRPPLHGGVDFGSGLWTRESKAVISYPPSKESLWDNEGWGITNGRRFLPSRCQLALLSLEAASAGVWPSHTCIIIAAKTRLARPFPGHRVRHGVSLEREGRRARAQSEHPHN